MYLLGEGHVPCIALSPGTGHHVLGEVYEVDAAALAVMDRLERLGEPTGYARVCIEVEPLDAGPADLLTTFVYAKSADQVAREARRVGPLAEYTAEHAAHFRWQGAS
jgi:gamma-glutamylaminecyclotransferase